MATTYIPRITREDDGDFLAELSVWTDGPVPDKTIFIGYFSTYQAAYEAACEASTDAAQRDVTDAAIAAQADTSACRTCGGPVEVDGSVGLFDDECDACGALACERCGESVSFDDATFLGDGMVCRTCYDAQRAHVAAMAALAAADDESRAAHEASLVAEYESQLDDVVAADTRCAGCGDPVNAADALTLAGLPVCASCHHSLEYSALRGADASDERRIYRELLTQVGAIADQWRDNDPPRTEAAEDRANRGGW